MPNPYANNDDAADFVDYYASDRMLASSVDRLYNGGMARQRQARLAAERAAYPERFEPPVRRSQAEIDHYLQARVETELLRRQQRRTALQRELYPEVETPAQVLEKKELARQVRRLYSDGVRQREARQRELEKVFGRQKTVDELVHSGRSPREVAELREREGQWRPPSSSVPNEDHRMTLSSQYDYYANPKKFTELYVIPKQQGRRMTAKERATQMKRLTELSQPMSVTPRCVGEERDPNEPPPFRVHKKVTYNDIM